MWLSDIIAIRNSKGEWPSPWKIPLWIFVLAKLLPPAVNSTLQVFMVFSIKFMTLSDILYILRQFIIQLYGTILYAFLKSIQAIARFFRLVCSHLWCVDLCKVTLLCLSIYCSILSVRPGTNRGLLESNKSLPLFVLLILFTPLVGKLWVCNYLGW